MSKVRDGYKETDIGVIPKDWSLERLKNLCTKITDGTHKTPKYTDSGIPFLRVTDIQKKDIDWDSVKYISEQEHIQLLKRCNPEVGDILYSKNGTIGIPKIIDWDREFSIFVSLCLIKVKDGSIDKKFLEQFLKSDNCLGQIKLRAKQGTVTNLHLEEIRELDIALPTKFEQQRIAEILSTTDEHIEKLDKTIEDYQLLKKGIMKKLLTEGIGHTEFKDTEIGRMPKEWEVRELEEISNYRRGSFPQPYGNPEWYDEDGYRFVQVYDVDDNFKLKSNTKRKISKLAIEKSVFAEKGTVLVTLQGSIGKTAITQYDAYIDRTLLLFTEFKVEFDKHYFMYVINELFDLEKEKADGGVIKTITIKTLSKFSIPIPSINEQRKIAEILETFTIALNLVIEEKQDFIQLKEGLMQQLLTGKIRTI